MSIAGAATGNPPKGWILSISSVDQNNELEIIGDVDSIPEVSEPSAKAFLKRHLENFPTTSVNPDEVWDGGRVPGVDEAQSQHETNLPMLLCDFNQQRTYTRLMRMIRMC